MSDEEKHEIIRHYVEVIEFRKTDDGGKVGVYGTCPADHVIDV